MVNKDFWICKKSHNLKHQSFKKKETDKSSWHGQWMWAIARVRPGSVAHGGLGALQGPRIPSTVQYLYSIQFKLDFISTFNNKCILMSTVS